MAGHGGAYRQIQYEEKLIDKADGPSDEPFAASNHRKALLALLVLCDACMFVLYLFSVSLDLASDVNDYTVDRSLFDVMVVSLVRIAMLLALLGAPKSAAGRWSCMLSLIYVVGKCVVWSRWNTDGAGTAYLMLQAGVVASEWGICRMFDAASDANESDPESATGPGAGPSGQVSRWNLLKVLGPYFWPKGMRNRVRVMSTWLCVGLSKTSNILGPLYIARAVNELRTGTVDYMAIGTYAVLAFSYVFWRQLQNIVYLRVKQTAYAQISESTFAHLHNLSLEWHLKKKMGNVLRSMDRGVNSANTVVSYLFLYLVPSLAECLIVFIIFYAHFKVPLLSVIAFFGLSGYVISTVEITIWRKKFRRATNRHDNALHDKATDSLINFETVKYFTNERYEIRDYQSSVEKYMANSTNTQTSLGMLNIIQQLFVDLTLGLVLCVAAYKVSEGSMTVGDFVAVNVYVVQMFTPLSFLGSVYNAIIQGFIDMSNLSDLLALEPDVTDVPGAQPVSPDPRGCEIEFRDVRFNYPALPDTTGLRGLSFKVERGTTTAIVGHTGAGKSTIGRLLFRFYDLKGGAIFIDGQDISRVTQQSLRRVIGVVPQDTVMFNKDIYHNVHYGNLEKTRDDVVRACKAAQIHEFIEKLPEKWDTKVGERGLKLSGGEKQRVAIARCLLKDPPIVLLDEATSSLDSITEQNVQKSLVSLGKNRTCIVIAHRLSTVAHANQILVLDKGRIAERGSHAELMELKGEYYKLWRTQANAEVKRDGGAADDADEKV